MPRGSKARRAARRERRLRGHGRAAFGLAVFMTGPIIAILLSRSMALGRLSRRQRVTGPITGGRPAI